MNTPSLEVREQSIKSHPEMTSIDYQTLKNWCTSGKILKQFRRYHQTVFYLDNHPKYRYAFLLSLISYFLTKKTITFYYAHGEKVCLSFSLVCKRGYRYLKEYPIERFLRDLRVNQILEGTNEIMMHIIQRNLLRDDWANKNEAYWE